jgi:hypothetical protein
MVLSLAAVLFSDTRLTILKEQIWLKLKSPNPGV